MSIANPWAWRLLLNLRIRSYKSNRYKTSLPSASQRTRSNANTVQRLKDPATRFLADNNLSYIFGYITKAKPSLGVKKHKGAKKGGTAKTKATPSKKKPARTVKKDV